MNKAFMDAAIECNIMLFAPTIAEVLQVAKKHAKECDVTGTLKYQLMNQEEKDYFVSSGCKYSSIGDLLCTTLYFIYWESEIKGMYHVRFGATL